MGIHPSILALRTPGTEEPDGLQFIGSQRVGYDWVTITFTILWTCYLPSIVLVTMWEISKVGYLICYFEKLEVWRDLEWSWCDPAVIWKLGKGLSHCGCALCVVLSRKRGSGWIPYGEVQDGQLCLMVAKSYMNTSN